MKIAIINTYDIQGGAARAAYRLHMGLTARGHDSRMIVRFKASGDAKVDAIVPASSLEDDESIACEMLSQYYIEQNRSKLSNTLFSFPYPGYDIAEHPAIITADILNLHWISFFQSPFTIHKLLNLGKPTVWTMHDQNAFTGGCHYSAGCTRYESDCIQCPQLMKDPSCLPAAVLNEKKSLFKRGFLTLVSPSQWLADCARKSQVLKRHRTEVIPNGLDTQIFLAHDKTEAKKTFGLGAEDFVILVGADSGREQRKGFHILRKVINQCMRDLSFCELITAGRLHFFAFGSHHDNIDHMGFPVRKLGRIDNDHQLSYAYAAADIFLFPSLEDNLPNTLLESLSCGTPVIAFSVGGVPEIIRDDQDGYLIPAFDIELMATRLLDFIGKVDSQKQLSRTARERAQKFFALDVQAASYEKLFQDLQSSKIFVQKFDFSAHSRVSSVKMGKELKSAVESSVFVINKSLLNSLRTVQADYSLLQKKFPELLSEKSDMQRQILYLQHQVNCLSTGRGALQTLFRRIIHKLQLSEHTPHSKNREVNSTCFESESDLNTKINSEAFSALATVRNMQANIDEQTLMHLFSFARTINRMLCIEPSMDMVQAAWMMSCAGVDVLCIGDNYELVFASKAALPVYYGDVIELLHLSKHMSLSQYECVLAPTSALPRIAWLLADAAHVLPKLLLYRSETALSWVLPQYAVIQSYGDFVFMQSTCLCQNMLSS